MDHAHKLEDDIESTKANIRTKTEQIKSMGLEIKVRTSDWCFVFFVGCV